MLTLTATRATTTSPSPSRMRTRRPARSTVPCRHPRRPASRQRARPAQAPQKGGAHRARSRSCLSCARLFYAAQCPRVLSKLLPRRPPLHRRARIHRTQKSRPTRLKTRKRRHHPALFPWPSRLVRRPQPRPSASRVPRRSSRSFRHSSRLILHDNYGRFLCRITLRHRTGCGVCAVLVDQPANVRHDVPAQKELDILHVTVSSYAPE